ncbi:N-acetylglucosaminyl transferase component-domain-containing protein [Cubamyces menziesii]|nr:N-acetylglucosaminyl transferase component-domain-containing protein [Cubamyces menziesii]
MTREHETALWPSDVTPCDGLCYGWLQPLVLVAGIIPLSYFEAGEQEEEAIVECAVADPRWHAVQDMFTAPPCVIGTCKAASPKNSLPTLSIRGTPSDQISHFVMYQRHRRQSMRFYAFDFTELDILPSQGSVHDPLPLSSKNANAVLSADFTRVRNLAASRASSLDAEVLNQANFAQLLADLVDRHLSRFKTNPERPSTPVPATPEIPAASASTSPQADGTLNPSRRACHSTAISKMFTLARRFSTTADQLDVRLEQGVYVANEVPYVYHDKTRTVTSISKYIKFHDCIWLVLNDVIIGVAFGSFLCENQYILAAWLEYLMQQYYLVHRMKLALLWLNNWPAGLKLNTELSQFYCHTLIGVVSAWGWLLERAAPYFPALIWAIGIAGCCGMTMIVSLLSDTLSLFTAHLYACYIISATVFRHQLSLAGSLWNLFRGKRYNVLRNRIDSWDYDLDQLLLGTILFTLLAFLYPTVLTYYALFATARLAVMMIHAVLDTATALLNHFPLFALLLRAKDPLRLPGTSSVATPICPSHDLDTPIAGGVCVQRSRKGPLVLTVSARSLDSLTPSRCPPTTLCAQSQPAPLSSIFRHYAHLAGRLTTHYHPLRLLRQLASGRLMTPIPRSAIRYNMIPVQQRKPDSSTATARLW